MPGTDTTDRRDIHARITAEIVAHLERGVRPWTRPWDASHLAGRIARPLRATGEPYRGINTVVLWMAAAAHGYTAPTWMTYRQAQALGGQVRMGEHGTAIAYADRHRKTKTDPDTGREVEREVFVWRQYVVFNAAQIDGLPEALPAEAPARIAAAEAFFSALGTDIRHGGGQAFYAPEPDVVRMPPFEAFKDAEGYYATLGHECIHWTGHPSRLARGLGGRRHDEEGYAREELTAEIGAAFVCADLGLRLEPREDHAAYIAGWLRLLCGDKRAVFTAAAQAQRAADFLHARQPATEEADEAPPAAA